MVNLCYYSQHIVLTYDGAVGVGKVSAGVRVAADGEAGQSHVVTGHGVLEDGSHYLRPHPTCHGHRLLLLDGAGSTVMTITISITSEQGYIMYVTLTKHMSPVSLPSPRPTLGPNPGG